MVAEIAVLSSAAGGFVLWIEIENDGLLPLELAQ
jgi:hypothetical protein